MVKLNNHLSFVNINDNKKRKLKFVKFTASKNDNKRDLNIGDKVYVRSLLNMVMFSRATIIDKIDDKYKVFYIDYGNNELVNSDDIFELPDEFKKVSDHSLVFLMNKFLLFI